MRAPAVVLAVAALLAAPTFTAAQDRFVAPSVVARALPRSHPGPVVTVAPVTFDDEDEASLAAIERASERLAERLRPLEDRLRSNDRLRRAGAVVGVGAVAIGAVRGTAPLTFAGTQALRFGLHRQLTAIERRSGFAVTPTIGHRSVSLTVNKIFR